MKLRSLALASMVLLVGCQSHPVMPETLPRFSGVTLGSGHRSGDDTAEGPGTEAISTSSDSTVARGVTLGSGH